MKSHPEEIELNQADLESKLDQIATVMGEDMARPFRQLLHWYVYLLALLREKKLSIQRLRRMLFGARTNFHNSADGDRHIFGGGELEIVRHQHLGRSSSAAQPWPDSGESVYRLRASDPDARIAVSRR